MLKRAITLAAAVALALGAAACGSSGPHIVLAPSGGATQAAIPAAPKVPADLSKEPVVTVPKTPAPSKLVIKDLIEGTGQVAKVGDTITVNYVGVLYKTGKTFDSSWSRNEPFTTPLTQGSVIPGWVQGIPGMRVGGRRELIIPANLAYGKSGSGSAIPPNSPLIFVVDLLSVSA
jgi:peptidylprolyl isomerase